MKKRIAILCNYQLLPSRIGGMDHFFWSFDRKCKEEQCEVDWYFPNSSEHGGYASLLIMPADGIVLEHFFLAALQTNQYDFIVTHFVELCTPFFKKLSKLTTAKIIAVDHNPRPEKGYPFRKKIEKRIKGFLYSRYVDVFVAVSGYTKNEIIRDFGAQTEPSIIVIYNGINTGMYHIAHGRNDPGRKFIVVSHLRFSKGIQDLIVAVSNIDPLLRSGIEIDIYGDGPFRPELESMVETTGTGEVFRFKGNTADLHLIYCNYDYMLQPTHMECFSLSILESLCANVPVLTTSVGGNTEVVTDGTNGYIIPPADTGRLTQLMNDIILGRKRIELDTSELIKSKFSIEYMVNAHFDLLKESIKSSLKVYIKK